MQVQAEVDVAIVMKAMQHAYTGELEHLTLLAGDIDFRDLCVFLTQTAGKKVSILSYRASYNEALHKSCTNGFFMDDIWEHITEKIPPVTDQNVID